MPESQKVIPMAQAPLSEQTNTVTGKPLACSLHPEPVIELRSGDTDPNAYHRSNPHFFCIVELVVNDEVRTPVDNGLGGVLVSSLHKLKLRENQGPTVAWCPFDGMTDWLQNALTSYLEICVPNTLELTASSLCFLNSDVMMPLANMQSS